MEYKGFLASLFDFSFSSLITEKIVQILYILMLIGAGLYVLTILAVAFNASSGVGIIALILSPLIFLFFAIIARVYAELLIVVFKIADHTAEVAANTRRGAVSAPPPVQPPNRRSGEFIWRSQAEWAAGQA